MTLPKDRIDGEILVAGDKIQRAIDMFHEKTGYRITEIVLFRNIRNGIVENSSVVSIKHSTSFKEN